MIQTNNCITMSLSQRNENKFTHKNLCMNIHGNFIHKSPKVETNQMSFNRWSGKPTLQFKREKILMYAATWKCLQRMMLSKKKKSQTQKITFCMTPFILNIGKDKTLEMENRLVATRAQGQGRGDAGGREGIVIKRVAQKVLVGMELLCFLTVVWLHEHTHDKIV